jgi:hypothetical protein
VQARLGATDLPLTLTQIVTAKAKGNPLFAEEIANYLVERGVVRKKPSGVEYDPAAIEPALPGSIQILLAARADQLSQADRYLLQAASVIGRRFSRDLLVAVTSAEDIDTRLSAVQALDLIHPNVASDEFSFKHALVRDALYNSLLQQPRSAFHLAIASEIEQRSHNRLAEVAETLPSVLGLFGGSQLRWTIVGTVCMAAAATAYYCSAILLPKALVDQGAAVSLSFGLTTLLFMVTIPGKLFIGFIMEIIGRRWTITYCLGGAIPGLVLMGLAHRTGTYATVAMSAGAIITGLTVLSSFSAVRVYLSEQFPTALRGRGHFFGEATARFFAGVLTPFLLEPHVGSATIFFGTITVVVAIGACVPLLFGKETVGQLEMITETTPKPSKM